MGRFSPFTTIGLRTVDINGNIKRGPTFLQPYACAADGSALNGITLGAGNFAYIPEFIGPILFATWNKGPFLLGYRPQVELNFAFLEFDNTKTTGTYGYDLILNYYADALRSNQFAPLQFNLYGGNGAQGTYWRGVYPTTPWAPKWAEGKQQTQGMTLTMKLEARALLTDLSGDGVVGSNALDSYSW